MKKLVIDIPDQIYDDIKRYGVIFEKQTNDVLKSVVNGVPLKDFLIHMKDPINEEVVKSYIKQIKEEKENKTMKNEAVEIRLYLTTSTIHIDNIPIRTMWDKSIRYKHDKKLGTYLYCQNINNEQEIHRSIIMLYEESLDNLRSAYEYYRSDPKNAVFDLRDIHGFVDLSDIVKSDRRKRVDVSKLTF